MIVLDTHAWIWWHTAPSSLSKRARAAIDEAATVGIAAISLWEFSMLAARGRLKLDREPLVWMQQALAQPRATLLPLTLEIAAASAQTDAHGDPADRLIVATAMLHRALLVTKDRRLRESATVATVW